eukprot:g60489.t1
MQLCNVLTIYIPFILFFIIWIYGTIVITKYEKNADEIDSTQRQLKDSTLMLGSWLVSRPCAERLFPPSDETGTGQNMVEYHAEEGIKVYNQSALQTLWTSCQVSFAHASPTELTFATQTLKKDGVVYFVPGLSKDWQNFGAYSVKAHWAYAYFSAIGAFICLVLFCILAVSDDDDDEKGWKVLSTLLNFFMIGMLPELVFFTWDEAGQLHFLLLSFKAINRWTSAVQYTFIIGLVGSESVILPVLSALLYVVNGIILAGIGLAVCAPYQKLIWVVFLLVYITWGCSLLHYCGDCSFNLNCNDCFGRRPRRQAHEAVVELDHAPELTRQNSAMRRAQSGAGRLVRQMSGGLQNQLNNLNRNADVPLVVGNEDQAPTEAAFQSVEFPSAAESPHWDLPSVNTPVKGADTPDANTSGGLLTAEELAAWKKKAREANTLLWLIARRAVLTGDHLPTGAVMQRVDEVEIVAVTHSERELPKIPLCSSYFNKGLLSPTQAYKYRPL